MSKNFEKDVMKKGSRTFYLSSKFFPKQVRRDVRRLYSFVRITDDYVDEAPVQPEKVEEIEKLFKQAMQYEHYDPTTHAWDDVPTKVVKNMVRLTQRYKFDPMWAQAFLESMKHDMKPAAMTRLEDSLRYVYGSAEVVGMMMAKIMKLPEDAWEAARLQGRAMQWINFLRDLKEDAERGRQYFPTSDLREAGLSDLSEATARANPKAFKKFVTIQLKRYRQWQKEAAAGYEHIPKHLLVPLKTAAEMYDWTAEMIEKDPFIIFKKKVKPRKSRIVARGLARKVKSKSGKAYRKARKLIRN